MCFFYILLAEMINSIYSIMAIEDNLLGNSYWRQFFNLTDLHLLEYAHDLKVCSVK